MPPLSNQLHWGPCPSMVCDLDTRGILPRLFFPHCPRECIVLAVYAMVHHQRMHRVGSRWTQLSSGLSSWYRKPPLEIHQVARAGGGWLLYVAPQSALRQRRLGNFQAAPSLLVSLPARGSLQGVPLFVPLLSRIRSELVKKTSKVVRRARGQLNATPGYPLLRPGTPDPAC